MKKLMLSTSEVHLLKEYEPDSIENSTEIDV